MGELVKPQAPKMKIKILKRWWAPARPWVTHCGACKGAATLFGSFDAARTSAIRHIAFHQRVANEIKE
jgi:hypothetical protein